MCPPGPKGRKIPPHRFWQEITRQVLGDSQQLSRCIAAPKGVLLVRTFPGGGRTTTYTFEAIIASLSPNEKVNFHKTGVFYHNFTSLPDILPFFDKK